MTYNSSTDQLAPGLESLLTENTHSYSQLGKVNRGTTSAGRSSTYTPLDVYTVQRNIETLSNTIKAVCAQMDAELDTLREAIGLLARKTDDIDEAMAGLPCASVMYSEAKSDFEALAAGNPP